MSLRFRVSYFLRSPLSTAANLPQVTVERKMQNIISAKARKGIPMTTAIQGYSNALLADQRVKGASSSSSTTAFREALFADAGARTEESASEDEAPVRGSTAASSLSPSFPTTLLQADGSDTAESVSSAADTRIADFRAWKTDYFKHGIGSDRRQEVTDSSAAFEAVVTKAAASNGFADPKTFLQSLSSSELGALQTIHCLAAPINVTSLSQEGATNLLLSPDKAQDIDHDGFEMVGTAKGWQFPPPDAPASVKQAWKDATANANDSDIMLLSGSFLPLSLGTGKSAYLGPDADYTNIVQRAIEGAKISSRSDEPAQHETRNKQLAQLQTFLDRLQTG